MSALWTREKGRIFEEETNTSKIRIASCSSKKAGSWLNNIPSANLGLRLPSKHFQTACALRIGADLCTPHNCLNCGILVNSSGDHILKCKRSLHKSIRHNAINKLICQGFKSKNIPALLEPQNIVYADSKRPDGCTLAPQRNGKFIAWDVSIVHPFSTQFIEHALSSPAVQQAEGHKERKYRNLSSDYQFVPIIFDIFGATGTQAQDLIHTLKPSVGENFLWQNLSLTLQRENATIILAYMSDFCAKAPNQA